MERKWRIRRTYQRWNWRKKRLMKKQAGHRRDWIYSLIRVEHWHEEIWLREGRETWKRKAFITHCSSRQQRTSVHPHDDVLHSRSTFIDIPTTLSVYSHPRGSTEDFPQPPRGTDGVPSEWEVGMSEIESVFRLVVDDYVVTSLSLLTVDHLVIVLLYPRMSVYIVVFSSPMPTSCILFSLFSVTSILSTPLVNPLNVPFFFDICTILLLAMDQQNFCLSTRNSCCGPITLPGRQMRSHAMHSAADNPYCFIIQHAISVPVRPNPAIHPYPVLSFSHLLYNALRLLRVLHRQSEWIVPLFYPMACFHRWNINRDDKIRHLWICE